MRVPPIELPLMERPLDVERLPIGPLADAVVVGVLVAKLVQQRLGFVQVEFVLLDR